MSLEKGPWDKRIKFIDADTKTPSLIKYLCVNMHTLYSYSMGASSTSPFPQYSSTPALGTHNPPHAPYPHTDTHGRPVLRAAWSEIRAEPTKNHVIKDTHKKSKSVANMRIPSDESKCHTVYLIEIWCKKLCLCFAKYSETNFNIQPHARNAPLLKVITLIQGKNAENF